MAVLLLFGNRSHVVPEAAVLIVHTYACLPADTNLSEVAPDMEEIKQ